MTSETAQILVVDDEALVRRVLGDALIQTGYRVRSVGSGDAALAALATTSADVVLLDLQLGDSDGVELMQVIRTRWPRTEVIILTAHGSMTSAIAAVRHGAADYLLKPIGVEELRARVSDVLARSRAGRERLERILTMSQQLQALVANEGLELTNAADELGPGQRADVYAAGPLVIDITQHLVRMHGEQIDLTPAEFAILHALARTPGAVITCAQIVQSFQASVADEDEARQMLRPHIVRLRRKLEPEPSNPAYIQSVRGIGYRWSSSGAAATNGT